VPKKFRTEHEAGPSSETDEELIARLTQGDAMVFEILVNRYQKSALRLALRFTMDQTEAEDRVQEAFLQVHRRIHQYNPETAPFKTWFFAILSNLCRNAIKKNKSASFIDLPEGTLAIGNPEGELAHEERRAALAMAIAKLPPNQRLALILRYEEGFSYADIAAALGVSINAVKSLLARAKRALRRELGKFEKKSSD
jgi:RNA polymerase sigma-70 factor (ECF subfamily)